MTNYSFQSVGPIFIIAGTTTYNILNVGYTVIDMDLLNNEQLLLVKKGLQYNYLISPDSVDALAYITTNAVEPGAVSAEQVQDIVGTMVVGQNGADATYSDIDNQVVIEVPGLDDKVDKVAGYGLSKNDFDDYLAEHSYSTIQAFHDTMSGAISSGGELSLTGGINFSISPGRGYAKDLNDDATLVEWLVPLTGSVAANGDNFIYVTYNGTVIQQNTRDNADAIYVGYIRTGFGNAQVVGWSPVRFTVKDYYFHLSQFITTGIGTIIEEGCNLSLQANPNQLKVSLGSGILWIDLTNKVIADTTTFTKLFESSDYGFIPDTVTAANTIDNAYVNVRANDHLTALVPMTTGYYKKDLFFITPEGALYYVYATEEYATEELAIAAPIPQVPEQIKHSIARVGSVVIQQGATSVVDIYDIRPMFSKVFQTGAANSPTTVIDHGDLTGLGADTHLLYHTDARGDIRYNTKAQITAFLAGKANTVHTHVIADTTGLQDVLDDKADVAHTHIIADVTGLQTALNGKEATIAATTSVDYYRGDKTFATLNKAAIGLGNVDNTSDANKPVSTATQTALNGKTDTGHTHAIADITGLQTAINGKEATVAAGTTAQYYRGDKSFQTLDKTAVGLANVDNTSDANKPISSATQTALNSKEGAITAGTTAQYWRGDKSFQTLDKTAVGLANVDNTSDASKPISTLTQTALNAKEPTVTAGTTGQYYRGDKSFQTLNSAAVGLGSVANVDTTNASNISSGTLDNARLSANLTEIGNETFVDGEIIQSFDGTLQNASLGVGVTGAVEITNSAGQILFDAPYAKGPLNQKSGYFEDFITYSATTISQIVARSTSGAGAGTSIGVAKSSDDTRNGVIVFTTGTSSGGRSACASGGSSYINFANIPIGGYEEVGFRFTIPTVSDGTQSFQVVAGFGDSSSGLIPTDGAYVSVGAGTVGFQANTSSNSTRTNSGSLLTTVANTDYVVRVRVSNIGGTLSTSHYVNGTQLGTDITTNIPSGAGRDLGIQFGIAKLAGNTARTVQLDWIYHESFKPRTINY